MIDNIKQEDQEKKDTKMDKLTSLMGRKTGKILIIYYRIERSS